MDDDRTDEIPVENCDDSLSESEQNTEGTHSRRATNWQLSEVQQKLRTGETEQNERQKSRKRQPTWLIVCSNSLVPRDCVPRTMNWCDMKICRLM